MSTLVPYERVNHIPLRFKALVSGYIREYESTKNTSSIPESIQLVILLFYYNALDTSILTDVECGKLLSLFKEKDKFKDLGAYSYNLIYRGTIDGWTEKHFKDRVHGNENVLCLIHTSEDNVFGGYTSCGWEITEEYFTQQSDDKAFLFSIRSNSGHEPALFNINTPSNALRNQQGFYCMFGDDCIYIHPRQSGNECPTIWFDSTADYEEAPEDMVIVHGIHTTAKEVEVFQLK